MINTFLIYSWLLPLPEQDKNTSLTPFLCMFKAPQNITIVAFNGLKSFILTHIFMLPYDLHFSLSFYGSLGITCFQSE